MLFNSFQFVIFLPLVLAGYYSLPHRAQNTFLLIASCAFYACWDWRFLFPLLASTSIDYYCASRMEDLLNAGGDPAKKRRQYLVLSIVTNLGLLGFFKYFNFFSTSLQEFLQAFGINSQLWTLRVILPVGISFYTFQALSYTIDVYRGQLHSTRSYRDFLLAVLYFPHLVAGPIQRAHSLLPQVVKPRVITADKIVEGLHLTVWGFFKKVVIADNVAGIVNLTFNSPNPDGFHSLIGIYAFAVQIYCDFSGYSDIARGVAKLMGFEFMLNFNLPYLAKNPQDFWARWHISLSSWLRDYLYIPLGGNRGGTGRVYRNLMLTMVIGGLWHGAAWNFVLWGFYHGSILILHRMFKAGVSRFGVIRPFGPTVSSLLSVLIMFQFTCYGWLLFRANSFTQIATITSSLMHPFTGIDWALATRLALFSSPLVIVQLIQSLTGKLFFLDFSSLRGEVRTAIYAALAYCVLFLGGTPQAFIYFQF
jgi:D-alanyl-lipoteichoic acid acyltransferase DltB (MBOAT superfamily)